MRIKNKYYVWIIWIAISIQNSLLLKYKIVGLELTDLAIVLCELILLLYIIINTKNNKIGIGLVYVLIFTLFHVIFAFGTGGTWFNIIRDVRNIIFLYLSYYIFKRLYINTKEIKKIFIICGLLNSIVYLIVMKSITTRNISVILWISVISTVIILLDKDKYPFWYYIIVIINIIVIMISQTRTLIIPIGVTFAILLYRYAKTIQLLKTILIVLLLCITLYISYKIGILNLVIARFNNIEFSNGNNTLSLRIMSVKLNFKNFSIYNWFFGKGIGKEIPYYHNFWGDDILMVGTDLEMLFPNYVMKFGIIPTGLVICNVIKQIKHSIDISKNNDSKLFFIILVVIFSGGMISGLVGPEASVIIGSIVGLICNKNNF